MQIRAGYDIAFECPQPTPMLLVLSIHPSRFADLATPHRDPVRSADPVEQLHRRLWQHLHAHHGAGGDHPHLHGIPVGDTGLPDAVAPEARQHPIEELPEDTLVFLLGSRYCETDRLGDMAWQLFGQLRPAGAA